MKLGLCNITAKLPGEGLCSCLPENRSVARKRGRGPRLRNPDLENAISRNRLLLLTIDCDIYTEIILSRSVLLNLFDVASHVSPRLWFWAHFTKNLFQNSWLGVIIALSRNISRPTWRSFAPHRLRSAGLDQWFQPGVNLLKGLSINCQAGPSPYALYNTERFINKFTKKHVGF